MYRPHQPGIPRTLKRSVSYIEQRPQESSADVVFCYWELRTLTRLDEDFLYLVLPDACIDIIFDVSEAPTFEGALVMTPHVAASTLNLGRSFAFAGIRLQPGAWLHTARDIVGAQTFIQKLAGTDLQLTISRLRSASHATERTELLDQIVHGCRQQGVVGRNPLVQMILSDLDTISSVDDMATLTGYSRRHVQRIFKEQLGYSPHDFLKIVRFQQALGKRVPHAYADQSHYIREFKRITEMTPGVFWQEHE